MENEEKISDVTEKIPEVKQKKAPREKIGAAKELLSLFSLTIKLLLRMSFILFCVVLAVFIIAIFNPEGVSNAIEIFKFLS